MRARRLLGSGMVAVAVGLALPVVVATPAAAHPLGNFSRNVYSGLVVTPSGVEVDAVVDLAEIPAVQERQGIDADDDGDVSSAESSAYATRACADHARRLTVGTRTGEASLRVTRAAVTYPDGVGGLPTLRLECRLSTQLDSTGLTFTEESVQGVGWHEVTAVGDGVKLVDADVPDSSVTARLTDYPEDLLGSPLETRTASLTWEVTGVASGEVGASSAATGDRASDPATEAFARLLGGRDLTLAVGVVSLLTAVLLGGMHALAPGHGKTLMAGYLVGTGGRWRDALRLGASVTLAHTAGVLLLGLAIATATTTAPERAYPWLTAASGVLAVAVGVALVRQARRARLGHGHGHGNEHGHGHGPHHDRREPLAVVGHTHSHSRGDSHEHPQHPHPHGHAHDHPHEHPRAHADDHAHGHSHGQVAPTPARARSAAVIGLAGGLVPSPSAVVVLLAGLALGRTWFAVLLVVAYGVGMGLALVGVGTALVRGRDVVLRLADRAGSSRVGRLVSVVPTIAAVAVVVSGTVLLSRGVSAL